MPKRLTTEQWVAKARAVHGDRYDYSKSVYTVMREKLIITCRVHGDFIQSPHGHVIVGTGCPECSGKRKLTTEEWINRCVAIHGKRYDYSLSVYKSSKEDIKIICPIHGVYETKAGTHMEGYGCIRCRPGKLRSPTTEDWILKAISVHGNKYIYENTEYTKNTEKVEIICRDHVSFWQTANNHLAGHGCPLCPSRYQNKSHVYIMKSDVGVKVGLAIDFYRRHKELSTGGQPFKSELCKAFVFENTPTARMIERKVHLKMKGKNLGLTGFIGCTEWFGVDVDYAAKTVAAVCKNEGVNLSEVAIQK